MPLFRSKAEDKVREAGYDPARLPPGQYLTEKWPVLHAGEVPRRRPGDLDAARLGRGRAASWRSRSTQLKALPGTEVTSDIHCVTRWSRFDARFKGVHWRELAKLCSPKPTARFAIAHAEHGFTANVPLAAIEDEHALVVYAADGEPLTPTTAGRCGCSSRRSTSGRARSGCAGSSCRRSTSPASGSATATTTTPTTGRRSATASDEKVWAELIRLEQAPPLGAAATIQFTGTFPNGVSFRRGERGVITELKLQEGRVFVGIRTEDGRVFKTGHPKAFTLLQPPPQHG